jgi:hypothetical protein
MKKLLLVPIMMAALIADALPATLEIGAHGGGAWWEPYFKEWVSGDHAGNQYLFSIGRNYSIDPTWQIGPELGVRFTDSLRWRNKYTYSRFKANASFLQEYFFVTSIYWDISQKIEKHNLDSIVDYSVHKYVRVLAGFKFQKYADKQKNYLVSTTPRISSISWDNVCNAPGGGVGVGLTYDVVKNFSLNLDARLLYLKPLLKMNQKGFLSGLSLPVISEFKPNYHWLGMDADLSLAYFIQQASLTIALGCKYQFLRNIGTNSNLNWVNVFNLTPKLNRNSDHQIELYLSAVYNLKLPD